MYVTFPPGITTISLPVPIKFPNSSCQIISVPATAGANSIFYGDKLLTTGNNDTSSDVNLLKSVGLPLTQLNN